MLDLCTPPHSLGELLASLRLQPLLAPRVAAAITAARVSGLADELLPACDAVVFAALRGEQP